jgi:hypothetical protein
LQIGKCTLCLRTANRIGGTVIYATANTILRSLNGERYSVKTQPFFLVPVRLG